MNRNMQAIAALGQAVFGKHWRRSVARVLRVHPSTIMRWERGKGAAQARDVHAMLVFAKRHYEGVWAAANRALDTLRFGLEPIRLPAQPAHPGADTKAPPMPDPSRPSWTRPWPRDPSSVPSLGNASG
jgi:hypothetical protein